MPRRGKEDIPVRNVPRHHAWFPSARARWVVIGVIIIGSAAFAVRQGPAVLVALVMALLTVLVEELVRAAARYWLRLV